jgi:hypothetical protein
MAKLVYTRDELLADHAYANGHEEAGYKLHGGFDARGNYISPRTLNRWPAVRAWQEQLARREWPLIDSTQRLLKRGNYPSVEQQRFLLGNGFGETFWDDLTITGVIEGRGGMLARTVMPDCQDIVVADIKHTCLRHLNKGLLEAQGYDEGGRKERGEGGHDAMWFAVRDALFGKDAYPVPEIPESLARPETGRRMPQIPKGHEELILLLMNVLMIEIGAENFFAFCQSVMRDPANFQDRRAAAEHAAQIVERIRTDEAIHVAYLTTALSELRSFTIRKLDGGTIPGKDLIDRVWDAMVEWHTVANAEASRTRNRAEILGRLNTRPNGGSLMAQFDELDRSSFGTRGALSEAS